MTNNYYSTFVNRAENSAAKASGKNILVMTEDNAGVAHPERYDPPDNIVQRAHVRGLAAYTALHKESLEDADAFWSSLARELLFWKSSDWSLPVCQ